MPTRGARRRGMTADVRISLLEDDCDDIDQRAIDNTVRLEQQIRELVEQVDKQLEVFRKASAKNTAVLVGILVSVTTAAILLAVNLAVAH